MALDIRDLYRTRLIHGAGDPSDPATKPLSSPEKFAAKRTNELTRTTATLLNNLAVGTIIAGVLSPWASGRTEPWVATFVLLVIAIVLHLSSRVVLRRFLQREE